jgi:hypothetical protein
MMAATTFNLVGGKGLDFCKGQKYTVKPRNFVQEQMGKLMMRQLQDYIWT